MYASSGLILYLSGALCQTVAFISITPAGPFPVICCAFLLSGFGLSLQHAHANGFTAALNSPTKMGIMHGTYGRNLPHSLEELHRLTQCIVRKALGL